MEKKLNCILLVDDDDATNFINRKVIEKLGVADHIEVALNGREAIDYLTNGGKYKKEGSEYPQPMLILLDINMPMMDGWEFLRAYHALEDNQKAKIIIVMLTTSFNPDDQIRAEKISEVSGFRNKPLTFEMLNGIMKIFFADFYNTKSLETKRVEVD